MLTKLTLAWGSISQQTLTTGKKYYFFTIPARVVRIGEAIRGAIHRRGGPDIPLVPRSGGQRAKYVLRKDTAVGNVFSLGDVLWQ